MHGPALLQKHTDKKTHLFLTPHLILNIFPPERRSQLAFWQRAFREIRRLDFNQFYFSNFFLFLRYLCRIVPRGNRKVVSGLCCGEMILQLPANIQQMWSLEKVRGQIYYFTVIEKRRMVSTVGKTLHAERVAKVRISLLLFFYISRMRSAWREHRTSLW